MAPGAHSVYAPPHGVFGQLPRFGLGSVSASSAVAFGGATHSALGAHAASSGRGASAHAGAALAASALLRVASGRMCGRRRGRGRRQDARGLARCSALADDFKCLLLDCDGVLWRGAEPIAGSAEAVQTLQRSGKEIAFVTNASARTRAAIAERISGMLGVPIPASDVVTSSSVAAAAVVARGNPTAFVVGAEGLREEMRLAGVTVVEPALPSTFDEAAFRAVAEALPPVGAVVVGHDEAFSYTTLAAASLFLQRGGDACAFIGTNPDVGNRDASGYLVPEAGALIAAVEAASGRRATVVGKPSPEVVRQLMRERNLEAAEVLVVGDRLDTDVRFGLSAGAKTCLVLTGVNTREEAEAVPASERPHHVRGCLRDVVVG